MEANLKELVALERECCPFLAFERMHLSDEMVLTIAGAASATALLDAAFGGAATCQ